MKKSDMKRLLEEYRADITALTNKNYEMEKQFRQAIEDANYYFDVLCKVHSMKRRRD